MKPNKSCGRVLYGPVWPPMVLFRPVWSLLVPTVMVMYIPDGHVWSYYGCLCSWMVRLTFLFKRVGNQNQNGVEHLNGQSHIYHTYLTYISDYISHKNLRNILRISGSGIPRHISGISKENCRWILGYVSATSRTFQRQISCILSSIYQAYCRHNTYSIDISDISHSILEQISGMSQYPLSLAGVCLSVFQQY